MVDMITRWLLFALGVVLIGAGLLAIAGQSTIPSRVAAALVGLAAVAGGWTMTRVARGHRANHKPTDSR